MKTILQSEISECALACLGMIASAHGAEYSLPELRDRFPSNSRGATLQNLTDYALALGFSARPVRLELDEVTSLHLPCILHWNLNHFVVLAKARRKVIEIVDPAIGRRQLSRLELSRSFTGVAVELTPIPDFRPRPARPQFSIRKLTGPITGIAAELSKIFLLAAALEIFLVLAPLLNQMVVDDAVSSHDHDVLLLLVSGFGLLLVIQVAISTARSYIVLRLGQTVNIQWASSVFSHMLRLPVTWFERRHLGDIVSRFQSISIIEQTITGSLIEAILDGCMSITTLILMLLYSPKLTAAVVVAMLAYGAVRWASYGPLRAASAEKVLTSAREHTHFIETLRSIVSLKIAGKEQFRGVRWKNLMVTVQGCDFRMGALNIVANSSNTLVFGALNLAILWMAARLIMEAQADGQEHFTLGMMFAFISYKEQFTTRAAGLLNYAIQLKMLSLQTARLADIALSNPEDAVLRSHGATSKLTSLQPTIEFKNVSFRYDGDKRWILRNANLFIDAGEKVALIGRSGWGKTTVLKLLLGVLKPVEGEILYGGAPARELGWAGIRDCIATVMQDDVLLSGNIRDNIAFFDETIDTQRVEYCAAQTGIYDDIIKMPMGFFTNIGDLGSGLSGGQKQRLLLARALYRHPTVLALDEATSHLDTATELIIANALRKLNLTMLLIAHRPETVASADQIVIMEEGRMRRIK